MPDAARQASEEVQLVQTVDGMEFVTFDPAHLRTATAQVDRHFEELDLSDEDTILLISTGADTAVLRPFADAAQMRRCSYMSADSFRFLNRGYLDLLAQVPLAAVFGVTTAIRQHIEDLSLDMDAVFGGAQIFATSAQSHSSLTDPTPSLRRWEVIGPLVALECREGLSMHVITGTAHLVTDDSGHLRVDLDGQEIAVPVSGSLREGSCSCGLPTPSIGLEGD